MQASDDALHAIARLHAQVERLVRESGDPEGARDFNVAAWLAQWLEAPAPALGGRRPLDYLDSADGVELVSRLLESQRGSSYW